MSDTTAVPPAEERGPGLAAPLALDPLSPFAAIMPIVVAIAIMTTPIPALWTLGAALVLLVLADLRRGPLLAAAVLALAALIGALLALSTPVERVGASPVVADVLGADLQRNQVLAGARLGGKLGAALSLFLLTGLLAGPQDLLRAMVAHLRVPYRVAYAGVAALGFRERFAIEYRVIREAHDLRGTRAAVDGGARAHGRGGAPRRAGVHVDGCARLRRLPPPDRALDAALAVARHAPRPGLLGAGRRHRRALRRRRPRPPRRLTRPPVLTRLSPADRPPIR